MAAELVDLLGEVDNESAASHEAYQKYPALRVFLSTGQKPHRQFLSEEMIVVAGASENFKGAASAPERPWFRPTITAFISLLDLPANWDSYGAKPLAIRAVAVAILMLGDIMLSETPTPSVVPLPDGGCNWSGIEQELILRLKSHPKATRPSSSTIDMAVLRYRRSLIL